MDLGISERVKPLRNDILEFVDKNKRGFWEVRGYHTHAEPFGEERYSYQEGPRAEMEP